MEVNWKKSTELPDGLVESALIAEFSDSIGGMLITHIANFERRTNEFQHKMDGDEMIWKINMTGEEMNMDKEFYWLDVTDFYDLPFPGMPDPNRPALSIV